jgi:hypothetical protein
MHGTVSTDILTLQNPALTVTVTTNPEPHFAHIDKSAGTVKANKYRPFSASNPTEHVGDS